ncbi:hypothetical protein QTG64_004290 [Vibrio vulnificus]|nr:hypothetical protein [Vibrio vulnificus]
MSNKFVKSVYQVSGVVIPISATLLSLIFLLVELGSDEYLKYVIGVSGFFIGIFTAYLILKLLGKIDAVEANDGEHYKNIIKSEVSEVGKKEIKKLIENGDYEKSEELAQKLMNMLGDKK